MIAAQIKALAERQPDAPGITVGDSAHSYGSLAERIAAIESRCTPRPSRPVGVWVDDGVALIASLAALDALGASAALLSASSSLQFVDETRHALDLAFVLTDKAGMQAPWLVSLAGDVATSQSAASRPPASGGGQSAGQVILFTSGTSGPPKPAVHTWQRLAAGINCADRYQGRRWLLAYDPTRFAGIQVWLQALLTGGCLCIPASRDPAEIARTLVDQHVEFASATPSFWRMLLGSVPAAQLAQARLVQVTLGGESIDQPILDRLRVTFPGARLTHIYASTEMGVCFAVSDGRAGFPASFLHPGALCCELRINADSELEIRSDRGMLGYVNELAATGQWFGTGDVVERRDDRVYFVGRKSETINVGGLKVFPAAVEQCIRGVPGVEEVRVRGVPSSLTGQLVGAEVQAAVGVDRTSLRRAILESCRGRLAKHQLPASIEFVERLPRSQTGKLTRAAEATHGN